MGITSVQQLRDGMPTLQRLPQMFNMDDGG
jgi:hypothetical protein